MTDSRDAATNPDTGGEAETLSDEAATPSDEAAEEAALEAYDLDGDGRISLSEEVRAGLGIADAHAEELADEPGLKGKVAGAAHRLLDKLDND